LHFVTQFSRLVTPLIAKISCTQTSGKKSYTLHPRKIIHHPSQKIQTLPNIGRYLNLVFTNIKRKDEIAVKYIIDIK